MAREAAKHRATGDRGQQWRTADSRLSGAATTGSGNRLSLQCVRDWVRLVRGASGRHGRCNATDTRSVEHAQSEESRSRCGFCTPSHTQYNRISQQWQLLHTDAGSSASVPRGCSQGPSTGIRCSTRADRQSRGSPITRTAVGQAREPRIARRHNAGAESGSRLTRTPTRRPSRLRVIV